MSRALPAALATAAAALALSGCIGGGAPKGNAHQGGVIRIAFGARPDSLDPAVASTPEAREALWIVYTPPLTYRRVDGAKGTGLIPGLAERMPTVSDDGRVYTFSFRRGLAYSDGTPLRASDFGRTVERVRALHSSGAALFAGVVSMAANDRTRTVTIRLKQPDSSFPYALASTYAGLVPRTAPLHDSSAKPPPGIGPYAIAGMRSTGGFVLRRRRRFSLPGVPDGNVDAIVVDIVPDPARATRAVIVGGLDYMHDPPPDALLPELRSKYEDRFGEHATVSTLAFVLDSRRKPFTDARVRRGIAYAVDVPVMKRLLAGRLEPGCTLLPPAVPGYQKPHPCPYGDRSAHADLEKALALVTKGGADGALVNIRASGGEAGRRVLGYYEQTLRKIGLRARLVSAAGRAGRRAQTWLAEPSPRLPSPGPFFDLVAADDPLLNVDVERLRLLPIGSGTDQAWGKLDSRVVGRAYVVPVGSAKQDTFLSERLDFDNCNRFNPVYGNDYSSFCLK